MSQFPDDQQNTRPNPRTSRPQPRPPVDATRRHQPVRPPSIPRIDEPGGKPPRNRAPLSVPWWAFALTILIVAGLTCGLWAYVLAAQGDSASALDTTPTPIFVVITATPTLQGALPPPTSEPGTPGNNSGDAAAQPTTPPEPTAILPPEATAPSVGIPISVGAQVRVEGTEGAGLAVRQGPGTDYTYFFVADDQDVFTVQDGPRSGDGYNWWYVVDPNDENRAGWAVDLFLVVQQ